jgi:exosortase
MAIGIILVVVPLALLWAYWETEIGLFREWQKDPNYSVGMLVPPAALYMLWQDRHSLRNCVPIPTYWGMAVILLAQLLRTHGLVFVYESAERYSMVLTIVGLVLLVAGWPIVRKTAWILAFLLLMIPLPGRIHNAVSGPLQGLATTGAVYALEVLGVTVAREGNVILLNDQVPIAVAEACSGLRMLTAFVVVGSVMAYIVNRPRWQKTILLLSTVPVAIACNLVRLVITAWLFLAADGDFAERFFHDFAGWTMMPLAVLILIAELAVLRLLVSGERSERMPLSLGTAGNRPVHMPADNALY